MDVDDYDYDLPAGSIAQVPIEPRSAARLLDGLDPGQPPLDRTVAELPELLGPGDVVVVNETKVLPARLHLRKHSGGAAEVLLLEPLGDDRWQALVRPGRRLPPGTPLFAPGDHRRVAPVVEVGDRLDDGRRVVRLLGDPETHGETPLPPYIQTPLTDAGRYQTVYARIPGSVAAPTAGLHFTSEVLDRIRVRGASVHTVDLAVGLDTFRPIASGQVEDHVMHTERYSVPESTMAACDAASRVIAIGTTCVRALESVAARGELEGRTDLFITPGFEFRVVDVLLTNFHLPRSSLLLLLAAFCGDRWRDLYATALERGYRFLSFGDAMLVGRGR
ncbi:MAG TPA: tRNA preQ1(34) S-adenosylmethionine ribosyltransferase-isomerase QueA [Acidimicrobiales bacterium]|nr:tRNA preQ1(34) S-adenosylmethionine ribosyltransferase-isomerase QueA [Acidimicrobiales bacterium]